MAEADRQKAEKYMIGLANFLDQYTLATAGKVVDFVSKAQIPPPDANALLKLTGSSVVVPGDSISLWVQGTTLYTTRMEVSTFFDGDIVVITSTFNALLNGLNYVAYTEATIRPKQLALQVHNYDYNPNTTSPMIQERQLSPSTVQLEIRDPAFAPGPKTTTGTTSPQSTEQKLKDLKSLLDQGLITQSDYDAKKAQILKDM
jgi:hypothetical protein